MNYGIINYFYRGVRHRWGTTSDLREETRKEAQTMKLNEIIAENLRVGMALKNLSVGEIAKETGLSINTVSGVKNNREKRILGRKLSTLAKISECLGITMKDLVTENTFLTEVN